MRELHISVDIEADGPIPGPHSMWSLGAAALLDGKLVGDFEVVFEELEGAAGDPDTLAWWAKQDKAIQEAARANPVHPKLGMARFVEWVEELCRRHKAKPVCVAYPAGFDFLFVYWYLVRFGHKDLFGFSCLDIKTYACALLGTPFRETTKRNMPKRWFKGLPPHTHRASDDAKEQGMLFHNMHKERQCRPQKR